MRILEIEDLRRAARRRVPRMFFDYADSGSWTESTCRRNERDFSDILLRQRVATDIRDRSLVSATVGQPVTMPVAHHVHRIAAMGAWVRGSETWYKTPCTCAKRGFLVSLPSVAKIAGFWSGDF